VKPVLFISDLHLDPSRPGIIRLFLEFLATDARSAAALYILGDLFEAWIGDDAVPADHPVLSGLRALSAGGVPVLVIRGNRDFLLGADFARHTGARLLDDPTCIELSGERVLLMHGDSLCIDDVEYQAFRRLVHDPSWQAGFLAKSIPERMALAGQARQESSARNAALADSAQGNAIMDVNAEAVIATLRAHGVRRLIHGHTHRPAIHTLGVDGEPATRIVLGDWYDQGSVLIHHPGPGQWELQGLPATP
jgi:UDP-2,3-diacylglucosamine hydrolase